MEIQNGRPADESGRLPKEIAVYNLLERLDIPFARADHAAAFTMEACESISAALQTPVCKNLFLCNRQKTNFYLLLMPADKPFHQPAGLCQTFLCIRRCHGTAAATDSRLCHDLRADA